MERPKTSFDRFNEGDSFIFKQRSGAVNWREIQNIDIEELIHKGDIKKIQDLLENLTYSNIDKSDLERFPDTFFLKLFRLSQFALEYLQENHRKVLEENKEILQEKQIVLQSAKQLEEQIETHKKVSSHLNREVLHKKKTLSTYEYLLKQPATMSYMNRAINRDKAVRCPKCGKFFETHEYFVNHHKRRHAEQAETSRPKTAPLEGLETIKNALEEQLKTIQGYQEKEIAAFKSLIQEQLLDMQKSKTQVLEVSTPIRPAGSGNMSGQIEQQRRELLEIKQRQRAHEATLRRKEEEIHRIELENQRLVKDKEKIERKMRSSKRSDRSRETGTAHREDPYFSNDENTPALRPKMRSESGFTNLVNSVMKDLIDDKSEYYRVEQSKEVDLFKQEAFTPYSERVSPSLRGMEGPQQYFLPLDSPNPQDIIEAAKVLGIDPVKETQYLYLAAEFLKSPIPKKWVVTQINNRTVFRNKETGEVQETHPGIEFYQEAFRLKRNRKDYTFDKVKDIVRRPRNRYLVGKYPEGVVVFFVPEEKIFRTQRMIMKDKVQSALDKMKTISIQQLNKMDEEIKKFSERGPEFKRANEMVNSELLTIFNKLKT